MKRPHFNKYYLNGTLLMVAAVALLVIAFLTNRGNLTGAGLVVAGFASFLLGIFLLTYSYGEPVDPEFVSLLPVQDCINLCRLMSDLGINGAAYVIPGKEGDDNLTQFNPAGVFHQPPSGDDSSFRLSPPVGMSTLPSGLPLYRRIGKSYGWTNPSDPLLVTQGMKEVAEDVYRVAGTVDTTFNIDLFTVTLRDFLYISGCESVQEEASPACCRMHPCPICSLMMCMVSGSLKLPCSIEQINVDGKENMLTVMIRVVRKEEESLPEKTGNQVSEE